MSISLRVLCVCVLCFCWGILETEIRCCMAHCWTEAANEFGKVECEEQGKQVYGMMSDGKQIYALISQLVYIVYLFFFFLFQATSMYLENKYLFEGFMVSIKSGFLKLGQRKQGKDSPQWKIDIYFQNVPCGLTNRQSFIAENISPLDSKSTVCNRSKSRDHKVGCAQTTVYLHTQKHTKYSMGPPSLQIVQDLA